MNNNLGNYLSKLDNHHKNNIINNCNKNKSFDNFILYSSKLNITLFNNNKNNTPKSHDYLLTKFKEYKEVLVRSFGIKIVKNYNEHLHNILFYIKHNYKKLEIKINYINSLIDILENIINDKTLYLLLSNKTENRKINYSLDSININKKKKLEIIDFSQDLFITSDELTTSDEYKQDNCVNLVLSQNTPFIAEYSN